MKPVALDLDHPMTSLRAAAGIEHAATLAGLRGVARSTQHQAEESGDRVSVGVLRAAAAAAGVELTILVSPSAVAKGKR